jgi:hypothetical protein
MNISSSSFRVIIVTSYVTITVLLAAYSAALISFMTVQDVHLPFTTFEGLLQHGEYRLATAQGTAHISYFNVRTDVLLRHYLIVTHSSSYLEKSLGYTSKISRSVIPNRGSAVPWGTAKCRNEKINITPLINA